MKKKKEVYDDDERNWELRPCRRNGRRGQMKCRRRRLIVCRELKFKTCVNIYKLQRWQWWWYHFYCYDQVDACWCAADGWIYLRLQTVAVPRRYVWMKSRSFHSFCTPFRSNKNRTMIARNSFLGTPRELPRGRPLRMVGGAWKGCNNCEIIKGDPIVKWRTLEDSVNSENNKIHILLIYLQRWEKFK